MSAVDAQIMAQLQSLKAAQAHMGNPMMGGLSGPFTPQMAAPGGPQALPPQSVPQLGPQGTQPGPNNSVLLSVAVDNLPFRYQLQEADLLEMTKRWGQVQSTHVYRDGAREVGVIVFADPIDAADCQRQINGHSCTFDSPAGGAQGSLVAAIGEPQQLAPPVQRPQAMQGAPGGLQMGAPGQFAAPGAGPPVGVGPMGGPPPMAIGQGQQGGAFPSQGLQGSPQMMGGMALQGAIPKSSAPPGEAPKGNGKAVGKGANGWAPQPGWSAKVIVHAERLHPSFPTVEKICGMDGANLHHIRAQGNCTVELRGMRSGRLDARTGQELPEPMFLFLSNDSQESGLGALEMVKDLLGSVYDEHQQWCMQNKLQWQENLQPQVVENPHLTEGFQ